MGVAVGLIVLMVVATVLATFPSFWLRRIRAFLDRAAQSRKSRTGTAGSRD
ncbi:MAG: hypothetical protein M0Z76_03320 [Gammaproteobacteria bacterium]|nr:hypothetical protein [Gammaproteobacteria bacterium]